MNHEDISTILKQEADAILNIPVTDRYEKPLI